MKPAEDTECLLYGPEEIADVNRRYEEQKRLQEPKFEWVKNGRRLFAFRYTKRKQIAVKAIAAATVIAIII